MLGNQNTYPIYNPISIIHLLWAEMPVKAKAPIKRLFTAKAIASVMFVFYFWLHNGLNIFYLKATLFE